MPTPDQEILDGRGEAALAALRVGVRGAAETALEIAEISRGEARDHGVDLVHQQGAGHAERPEDALGEEVAQLFAGELLDDQAEQQEVRVAVEEAAARREVEMVVAHAGGQKVLWPRRLVESMPARPKQLEEIGQAARVAHHLVDGDSQRLEVAEILVRRIGELELAFLGQHQRGARRELLAHRGDAKARPRLDWYAQFDAGEPITLAQLDVAAPHDGNDGAWRTGPGVTGEQRVDATFEGDGSDRFRHAVYSSAVPAPCHAE